MLVPVVVASARGPAAGSSGSSSGASGGMNSSITSTAADVLPCQARCQTGGSSCQSTCYQQYNVTNQTQYWSQCMQGCGTKLSVCSNNCISGVTLPPISTVLPPPPPAAPSLSSQPTRSPPPPSQPDNSSSSSSSSPPRGANDGCRRRWRSLRNVFLPSPCTLKSHAVPAVAFGTNAVSLERPDLYWVVTAIVMVFPPYAATNHAARASADALDRTIGMGEYQRSASKARIWRSSKAPFNQSNAITGVDGRVG